MFSAAYFALPFSPLVALTEVVDVDMLDAQSPTWGTQIHTHRTNLCPGLIQKKQNYY